MNGSPLRNRALKMVEKAKQMNVRQTVKIGFDAGLTQSLDLDEFREEQPPQVELKPCQ
jgi:hypothetical protein